MSAESFLDYRTTQSKLETNVSLLTFCAVVVFLHVHHAPCQAEPGDSLLPASFRDVADVETLTVTPESFSSTASGVCVRECMCVCV